jgi:signal transduction histidine kinase/ligand-binding sensor domain-containing protein
MKINLPVLFLFLYIQTQANCSFGQHGYSVKHYTAENGLPQNSVKSISGDSEGFVWLATEDGLVRFDGRGFYVFNTSNLNVKSNRVNIIKPSSRNSILPENVLTGSGRAQVTYAKFGLDEAVKIENGRATYDTNYSLNRDIKLHPLKKDSKDIYSVLGLPDLWYRSSVPNYRFMITGGSEEGNFYVCTPTHVNYFRNWKRQYKIANPVADLWNYFSIGERLYYFQRRKSFIKIFDKNLSRFPLTGDILYNPAYKAGNSDFKLYWNNNSDQAFLFLAGNLYTLEQQKNGYLATKLLVEDFDLPPREINVVYFDKTGGKIYLGSSTNGLYVLSKHQFQTLTVAGENRPNIFYSQLPYQNNTVLTPTGIIVGKDIRTNTIIDKRLPVLKESNPSDRRIIIRDKNANIWVKNHGTLIQLSRNGEQIIKQWKFGNEVKAICQGKDSQIWVGVINEGLYKVDPDAGPKFFGTDSLKNITYLESLSKQQLLAGSVTGLYKIDLSRKKKPTLVEGTKDVYIKSIHISGPDRIWITAEKKGLMLLSGKEGLVLFPLDKNRYLATPHCVVDDGLGYIWVPTNRGLFQMNINDLLLYAKIKTADTGKTPAGQNQPLPELLYMYHTMDEGFNTNEFNGSCQPCGVRLANGHISLPSLNGLVWFKPGHINRYVPDGRIILDKAELNQQTLRISGDTIQFPLNPENIKIYFSTSYFGNDYNLNLSYALLKPGSAYKPPEWLPLDNKDFTVHYSSLNSGRYTLVIRKQNGFGINNYSYKRVYLIVPQRWYETTWAVSLFFATITLVLIFGVHFYNIYRLKIIQRKNLQLEELVLSRTNSLENALIELRESKDQLNNQVHIMSRLLTSITHDVQSPLNYIAFASGHIPKMVEQQKFDGISEIGTMIAGLSQRTGNMLRDLLNYIKIQVYGKRMVSEEINLRALIDSKLEIFKNVTAHKGILLSNQIPDTIQINYDYHLLSIVIHNLIDNAVKYSGQGQIRIDATDNNPNETELVISNHGIPLAQEIIDIVNSPATEFNHPFQIERTTGLGLIIVKEVAQLIGIKVYVTQTDITSFHLLLNR